MLSVVCTTPGESSSLPPLALAAVLYIRAPSWLPRHRQSSPRDPQKWSVSQSRIEAALHPPVVALQKAVRHVSRVTFKSAKNSGTPTTFSPSFLPRHTILYHGAELFATSLTCGPDYVLPLANMAVKWVMLFSCFTEVWLDWIHLVLYNPSQSRSERCS